MTCSGGTGIAGDYLAQCEADAIKAATDEHGDEWTYYVFKEKEINTDKSYTYKITIDDSVCVYQYSIQCAGEASAYDIATVVAKYLKCDEDMGEGKYVAGSGKV